jgi:predicted YcjX-like family ATPase
MTFNRCVFHIKLVQLSGRISEDLELDFDQFAEEQQFVNTELQGKIDELRDTVARMDSVDESVKTFIAGIPQLIDEAVQKVQAEGVSAEQLTAMDDLKAHIQASVDELTNAITTPGSGATPTQPAPAEPAPTETPVDPTAAGTVPDATGFSDATFNATNGN